MTKQYERKKIKTYYDCNEKIRYIFVNDFNDARKVSTITMISTTTTTTTTITTTQV